MADPKDKSYFANRARREREIAATCTDKSIERVHLRMADEYDKRTDGVRCGLQTAREG